MRIWVLMSAPFLMMVVAAGLALHWDFNETLGPREKKFAALRIERVAAPLKGVDLSLLKNGAFRVQRVSSALMNGTAVKGASDDLKITLIVISDKKSIAAVDGHVLSTGDLVRGFKVKRIEKDRVLFAGKKEFWKKMENMR